MPFRSVYIRNRSTRVGPDARVKGDGFPVSVALRSHPSRPKPCYRHTRDGTLPEHLP
ncbi:MAG: hypothetical protein OXC02_10785 [Rhodobacteraceae bacterium]|nr:hypothetical protein [Paracoccaceae bacterium]